MKNIKDITCISLSVGLMILLMIIVVGDFYVSLKEHRPVDESVINLLQMAVTGIIGIVAGYLSGIKKGSIMILQKPVLTGPSSTSIIEIKERMRMMTEKTLRIKAKKLLGLNLHQKTREEEKRAARSTIDYVA